MNPRFIGKTGETAFKMLRLLPQRKGWSTATDMEKFYVGQQLLQMIRSETITEENLEEYVLGDKIDWHSAMNWFYDHKKNWDKYHRSMVYQNMTLSNNPVYANARVNSDMLITMKEQMLYWRLHNYLNQNNDMKQKILCIVGKSGTGKTTASLHLTKKYGANTICSYTTRRPRLEETEGVEHHFTDIIPDPSELLAYTVYDGSAYYALKSQVHGACTVYVIDEEGLRNLIAAHGNEYEIFSVYIKRMLKSCWEAGVPAARTRRDKGRKPFADKEYNWIIDNNGRLEELFNNIDAIYESVVKA